MENRSTAPYPPQPPYNSTMCYPGPHPPSYGSPYPPTSGTPNHPVAPPTVGIGIGEVHAVGPNHDPSSMVVVHKIHQPHPKLQCCFSVIFGIVFVIVLIVVLVNIIRSSSRMSSA